MTWVALREELGWHLVELESGTVIRPGQSGCLFWVERVTPEDRIRLDDLKEDHHPDWWMEHNPYRLTDAANEHDAERAVLMFAKALGAKILTDHTGKLLKTGWTADLLREP